MARSKLCIAVLFAFIVVFPFESEQACGGVLTAAVLPADILQPGVPHANCQWVISGAGYRIVIAIEDFFLSTGDNLIIYDGACLGSTLARLSSTSSPSDVYMYITTKTSACVQFTSGSSGSSSWLLEYSRGPALPPSPPASDPCGNTYLTATVSSKVLSSRSKCRWMIWADTGYIQMDVTSMGCGYLNIYDGTSGDQIAQLAAFRTGSLRTTSDMARIEFMPTCSAGQFRMLYHTQ